MLDIRQATESDIGIIYELICALEKTDFPKDEFERLFSQNNANENIRYFVAESNGDVVGFSSIYINSLLHHCGKIGEIQELVVSPQQRRMQVGKSLIDAMIQWATIHGAMQLEVTCSLTRKSAHAFYESLGFVHTHKKFVHTVGMR